MSSRLSCFCHEKLNERLDEIKRHLVPTCAVALGFATWQAQEPAKVLWGLTSHVCEKSLPIQSGSGFKRTEFGSGTEAFMNSHVAQVAQVGDWIGPSRCILLKFCCILSAKRCEKFYPGRVDGRQNGCPAGPGAGIHDA